MLDFPRKWQRAHLRKTGDGPWMYLSVPTFNVKSSARYRYWRYMSLGMQQGREQAVQLGAGCGELTHFLVREVPTCVYEEIVAGALDPQ